MTRTAIYETTKIVKKQQKSSSLTYYQINPKALGMFMYRKCFFNYAEKC